MEVRVPASKRCVTVSDKEHEPLIRILTEMDSPNDWVFGKFIFILIVILRPKWIQNSDEL